MQENRTFRLMILPCPRAQHGSVPLRFSRNNQPNRSNRDTLSSSCGGGFDFQPCRPAARNRAPWYLVLHGIHFWAHYKWSTPTRLLSLPHRLGNWGRQMWSIHVNTMRFRHVVANQNATARESELHKFHRATGLSSPIGRNKVKMGPKEPSDRFKANVRVPGWKLALMKLPTYHE